MSFIMGDQCVVVRAVLGAPTVERGASDGAERTSDDVAASAGLCAAVLPG